MGTIFKKENGQLNVYFNGVHVASIFKIDKQQAKANPHCPTAWHCDHYALAYCAGKYERYDKLTDARNDAKKITAKTRRDRA